MQEFRKNAPILKTFPRPAFACILQHAGHDETAWYVAASHILEGHVIIIVDTSPSVIITPTTLFHHVQHAEEYRQTPAVGTCILQHAGHDETAWSA